MLRNFIDNIITLALEGNHLCRLIAKHGGVRSLLTICVNPRRRNVRVNAFRALGKQGLIVIKMEQFWKIIWIFFFFFTKNYACTYLNFKTHCAHRWVQTNYFEQYKFQKSHSEFKHYVIFRVCSPGRLTYGFFFVQLTDFNGKNFCSYHHCNKKINKLATLGQTDFFFCKFTV